MLAVALRKESVDRNQQGRNGQNIKRVALRKESVDRNNAVQVIVIVMDVALRKESVDRNILRGQLPAPKPPSLSARRAWIEIAMTSQISVSTVGRSPQGERG